MVQATFRAADHADMETLLSLRREFFRHEHLAFDEETARRSLAGLIDDPSRGDVWLIDAKGGTVGYFVLIFNFSLGFAGRDAVVEEIYLRESHRGGGLGRQALRFAETACAARGIETLHLAAACQNRRALAACLSAGFKERHQFLMTKRIHINVDANLELHQEQGGDRDDRSGNAWRNVGLPGLRPDVRIALRSSRRGQSGRRDAGNLSELSAAHSSRLDRAVAVAGGEVD